MTFNKNGTIEFTQEEKYILSDIYAAARDFDCEDYNNNCKKCPFQKEERCVIGKIFNATLDILYEL